MLVPAAAIGGLSIILAVGLGALGVLDRVGPAIAELVSRHGRESFPKRLPDWSVWLAAVLFAFGLALAVLSTPGVWRRFVLWLSSLVVIAAWAPVLSLASHAPDVAAPLVATLWSGVCALVYASKHHMACDEEGPDDS